MQYFVVNEVKMNFNINHAEILIDKMLDYYSVVTYSELANNINTTQQTISSWKQRNSVSAIKKKCKENVPIKNWSEEVKKIKKEIDVLEEKHYTMLDNREDTTEINSALKTMYLRLEKAREKRDKEKSSKDDEVYMSERSLPKIKLKYE